LYISIESINESAENILFVYFKKNTHTTFHTHTKITEYALTTLD